MRKRGFTLVEMLVMLALIALIVAMAAPVYSLIQTRHKEAELSENLRTIRLAIDAYKTAATEHRIAVSPDTSGYPPNLAVLWQGVSDITRADQRKLYFLRSLPRDPFYPDPLTPADQTWAQRAYASPPEAPQPGEDVYDVHSMSPDTGLNGVPYRHW